MKIQSTENVLTVSPEKSWKKDEVKDLPEKVALQLLTNPIFKAVKSKYGSVTPKANTIKDRKLK